MDFSDIKEHFSLREFIVDFFGSLMPGVLFLFFLVIGFITSIISALTLIKCGMDECIDINNSLPQMMYFISQMPALSIVTFFLIFLTIGYVIGTLFYRRDPRIPDYRSFIRIAGNYKQPRDIEHWVVRVKTKTKDDIDNRINEFSVVKKIFYKIFLLKKTLKLIDEEILREKTEEALKRGIKIEEVEYKAMPFINNGYLINCLTVQENEVLFPYNNLSKYLELRGNEDLAKRVYWKLEEEKTNETLTAVRSKTFINALKIRLQFYFPNKCGTINKNEAHIRLTSSMWYASSALMKLTAFGIIIVSICLVLFYDGSTSSEFILLSFLSNLGVLFFSFRTRINSESFLHYQRVREIFYVLETAQVATISMGIPEDSSYKISEAECEKIFWG